MSSASKTRSSALSGGSKWTPKAAIEKAKQGPAKQVNTRLKDKPNPFLAIVIPGRYGENAGELAWNPKPGYEKLLLAVPRDNNGVSFGSSVRCILMYY